MINHIIYNDLTDIDYINNHTNGFEELKEHVKDKDPKWASKITGISEEDIKNWLKKLLQFNQLE